MPDLSIPPQDPTEQIMHFGKYQGESVEWVATNDPEYLCWAYDNVDHFTCDHDVYLFCYGIKKSE